MAGRETIVTSVSQSLDVVRHRYAHAILCRECLYHALSDPFCQQHCQQILPQAIAMSQGNASVCLAMAERTVTLVCLTVLLMGYVTALRINTGQLYIPEHTVKM